MNKQHTMIKVTKETRDFLKKAAPMLGLTMQEAAALAIERLVNDKAHWILQHTAESEDR